MPSLMDVPAGGSLTADQWLIAALIVISVAVRASRALISALETDIAVQTPQIWDEYCTSDPEVVRLQRMNDYKALAEKQKAARAAARKERESAKVSAAANARKSSRPRKKTKRAGV